MSNLLCEINILDIDLKDERYKISSFQDDISFLAQSIKETGLITPPVVRPEGKKYIIVSGFNRVRAALYNKEKKILVYKPAPDGQDETGYKSLVTAITALSFKRALTQAELISSAMSLNKFLDENKIAQKSGAIFNTELNAKFVKDLLSIGALPDPALNLIHSGNLSFKSARRITSYEKETIKVFLSIFSKIKASASIQLEIILHAKEIAARDSISPKDLFLDQQIQDILYDENKEPVLKTKELRSYLFEQRFPNIFQARQEVLGKIGSIKLGNKIKFLPPENFESLNYSISFTAKNHDEFKTNIKHLATAVDNETLKEIFNK